LAVSAWGTGVTRRGFYGWLLWRLIGNRIADKEIAERLIRESGCEYVIALPTILTDGPRTGEYHVGHDLHLSWMPRISRADTAHFIVDQIEQSTHLGRSVEISLT
jgi:putative NADH-flavin reductase